MTAGSKSAAALPVHGLVLNQGQLLQELRENVSYQTSSRSDDQQSSHDPSEQKQP